MRKAAGTAARAGYARTAPSNPCVPRSHVIHHRERAEHHEPHGARERRHAGTRDGGRAERNWRPGSSRLPRGPARRGTSSPDARPRRARRSRRPRPRGPGRGRSPRRLSHPARPAAPSARCWRRGSSQRPPTTSNDWRRAAAGSSRNASNDEEPVGRDGRREARPATREASRPPRSGPRGTRPAHPRPPPPPWTGTCAPGGPLGTAPRRRTAASPAIPLDVPGPATGPPPRRRLKPETPARACPARTARGGPSHFAGGRPDETRPTVLPPASIPDHPAAPRPRSAWKACRPKEP